jgi:hypothetical protein
LRQIENQTIPQRWEKAARRAFGGMVAYDRCSILIRNVRQMTIEKKKRTLKI